MIIFRKLSLTPVILIVLLPAFVFAQQYEEPPAFQAKEILKPSLYQGKHHRVSDVVRNDGYMNHFTITSDFGNYEAQGELALMQLIREIAALAVLSEHSTAEVAIDTTKDVAVDMVKAPVRGAKKLAAKAKDKEGLTNTAKAVPGGVLNLFKGAAGVAKEGAGKIYDAGKASLSGDTKGAAKASGSVYSSAKKHGLEYLGYTAAYNKWAKNLGVDPYTTNEILEDELTRVARTETAVKYAKKFAPGIPSIPGVGAANKYMEMAEDAAIYKDPAEVERLNKEILDSLGSDAEKDVKVLLENEYFTLTAKSLLSRSIDQLKGVENRTKLLRMAGTAESYAGASYYVTAAQALVDYHQKEKPLEALVSGVKLPAGVTAKGRLILPLPVDHLVLTKEIAAIIKDFKERVSAEHKITYAELRIAGTVSQTCRTELLKHGADKIVDKVGY